MAYQDSTSIVAACHTCAFRFPDGIEAPEYLTAARARYHVERDHDVRPVGKTLRGMKVQIQLKKD